jgi:hypothetical protein
MLGRTAPLMASWAPTTARACHVETRIKATVELLRLLLADAKRVVHDSDT